MYENTNIFKYACLHNDINGYVFTTISRLIQLHITDVAPAQKLGAYKEKSGY